MKIFVAILTYRRVAALKTCLESFVKHLPLDPKVSPKARDVELAIFEDCGNADSTRELLTEGAGVTSYDAELEAEMHANNQWAAFMGDRNVGVAANSNKAIRWFERSAVALGCADAVLLLCNDDIVALSDFSQFYAKALNDLKLGLLCYAPTELGEAYLGPAVPVKGHTLRLCPQGRQTGCMMAISRKLVATIGYYDVVFGRMGQEHVDYTSRAMLAGFINLRDKPQICLDVVPTQPCLQLQRVQSSVTGGERASMDAYANDIVIKNSARYRTESWYRPYRLLHAQKAGAHGGLGTKINLLEALGHPLLADRFRPAPE